MKKYILVLFIFLISCSMGSKVVTQESFSNVDIGITVLQLKAELGKPNSTKTLASGHEEYVYIERVSAGGQLFEVKKYIIIIKDKKVIDKKMVFEKEPVPDEILRRNAFDLQTSFN